MDRDRAWWGVLLLAVGSLFLADQLELIDAWSVISGWWPLAVVLAGALRLTERPPDVRGAAIVSTVGLALLAWRQQLLPDDLWAYAVPVALIVVGLTLLLRRRPAAAKAGRGDGHVDRRDLDAQRLDVAVVLSGRELRVTGPRFEGGKVTVTLGGVDLDLREAVLPAEGAELFLRATLGGIDVTLPAGWNVQVSGSAVLGGTDDDTLPAETGAPVLWVRTAATLGGIDLTTDPQARARTHLDAEPPTEP